jgi:tetratricopeptide (TPR) repeat protein
MSFARRAIGAVVVFVIAVGVGIAIRARSDDVLDEDAMHERLAVARYEHGHRDPERAVVALRLLSQIPRDSAVSAAARALEGTIYHSLHRWSIAESAWREALSLDPRASDPVWLILDLCFVEQRPDDARRIALEVFDQNDDPIIRSHLLLELTRQELENISNKDLILLLERVVVREPDNRHALRVLGLSYVQVGRKSEGTRILEELVASDPSDALAWDALVACLSQTSRFDRLRELRSTMPQTVLDRWEMRGALAMAAEAAGDLEGAVSERRAALAVNPFDRRGSAHLAQLLRHLGDEEKAREYQEKSRALDAAREGLASAYQTARNEHRNHPDAALCERFAGLCRRLGRVEEAQRWTIEANRRRDGARTPG